MVETIKSPSILIVDEYMQALLDGKISLDNEGRL